MIALVLNQFSSCHVLSRISTVVDLVRTFSCVITLESPCRVEELRPLTNGEEVAEVSDRGGGTDVGRNSGDESYG